MSNEYMDASISIEKVSQVQIVKNLELRIWQQALWAYEQDLDMLSVII